MKISYPERESSGGERISELVTPLSNVRASVSMRMSEIQSSKLRSRSVSRSEFVPGAGLEPARPQRPQDFKSGVSTNSTIRANWDGKDNFFSGLANLKNGF